MDAPTGLSLLIREFTIIARQHSELARHYKVASQTLRRVLDNYPADLLPSPTREKDGVVSTQPYLEFGAGSEKDYDA